MAKLIDARRELLLVLVGTLLSVLGCSAFEPPAVPHTARQTIAALDTAIELAAIEVRHASEAGLISDADRQRAKKLLQLAALAVDEAREVIVSGRQADISAMLDRAQSALALVQSVLGAPGRDKL